MFCLHGCLCTMCMHATASRSWEQSTRFLRSGVTGGCRLPCECWELNLGPMQEQKVLLTFKHLSRASSWLLRWEFPVVHLNARLLKRSVTYRSVTYMLAGTSTALTTRVPSQGVTGQTRVDLTHSIGGVDFQGSWFAISPELVQQFFSHCQWFSTSISDSPRCILPFCCLWTGKTCSSQGWVGVGRV